MKVLVLKFFLLAMLILLLKSIGHWLTPFIILSLTFFNNISKQKIQVTILSNFNIDIIGNARKSSVKKFYK